MEIIAPNKVKCPICGREKDALRVNLETPFKKTYLRGRVFEPRMESFSRSRGKLRSIPPSIRGRSSLIGFGIRGIRGSESGRGSGIWDGRVEEFRPSSRKRMRKSLDDILVISFKKRGAKKKVNIMS